MNTTMPDCRTLADRAARRGVLITLTLPLAVFLVAYAVHAFGLAAGSFGSSPSGPLVFYVLLCVGIADVGAAVFLKRTLFAPQRFRAHAQDPAGFERAVMSAAAVLFSLAAAPAIYGAVLLLLGFSTEKMAVFAILNLIGYRLVRPSTEFLEKLLTQVAEQPPSLAPSPPVVR